MTTPHQILKQYFGYDSFRAGQEEIINSIVEGRDTLAILPTGGGKSLCFQVPALCLGGTTLVISPLISLMKDQIVNLTKLGLRATFINSSLTKEENRTRLDHLQHGHYQFVYISPEKLQSQVFRQVCRHTTINFIALDEAHCLSMWGHDFRPSYLMITDFIDAVFSTKKPRPTVAAYTATATKLVIADILQHGGLRNNALVVQKSFARPNLHIFVKPCDNEHHKLLTILRLLNKHRGQCGIIYVLTRKRALELTQKLNRLIQTWRQPPLKYYHGGQNSLLRSKIQDEFLAGETPVIIATNAFGMGVDKSDVRFVIHDQMSSNLENYYQEIGRGGRDGEVAHCYTVFTPGDLDINHRFIKNSNSPYEQKRVAYQKLRAVKNYLANQEQCRQQQILNYFDEPDAPPCAHCDVCLRTENRAKQNPIYLNKTSQQYQYFTQLLAVRHRLAVKHNLLAHTICNNLSLHFAAAIGESVWQKPQIVPGFGSGFLQKFATYFAQCVRRDSNPRPSA